MARCSPLAVWPRRWQRLTLLCVAGFGLVFAAGDARELVHQPNESNASVRSRCADAPPRGPSATIRRLNPATGHTAIASSLRHPLTDAAVASIGSTIYLLGSISHDPLATILAVHPR